MALNHVALGQPHVEAHNAERDVLNALLDSVAARYTKPIDGIPSTDLAADVQDALTEGVEIVQSENRTNTPTSVTGSLVYSQVDGCGIVVPPQSGPWRIEWEACLQVVTAGAGAMYIALMEIPSGGGTPTMVASAVREILASNSGTYSKVAGTTGSSRRFDPSTTYRSFCLSAVNLLDSGSSLATNIANSPTNPSFIRAVKL